MVTCSVLATLGVHRWVARPVGGKLALVCSACGTLDNEENR